MASITSDQIREYVQKHYVERARKAHHPRFSVRCGTVEKELGMSNRINHVCSALKSRKFLGPNGLRLAETSGPPSGMSTTVEYTYEFDDSQAGQAKTIASQLSVYDQLRGLEGILKDVYKELGGAEKVLKDEREGFSR